MIFTNVRIDGDGGGVGLDGLIIGVVDDDVVIAGLVERGRFAGPACGWSGRTTARLSDH